MMDVLDESACSAMYSDIPSTFDYFSLGGKVPQEKFPGCRSDG